MIYVRIYLIIYSRIRSNNYQFFGKFVKDLCENYFYRYIKSWTK